MIVGMGYKTSNELLNTKFTYSWNIIFLYREENLGPKVDRDAFRPRWVACFKKKEEQLWRRVWKKMNFHYKESLQKKINSVPLGKICILVCCLDIAVNMNPPLTPKRR